VLACLPGVDKTLMPPPPTPHKHRPNTPKISSQRQRRLWRAAGATWRTCAPFLLHFKAVSSENQKPDFFGQIPNSPNPNLGIRPNPKSPEAKFLIDQRPNPQMLPSGHPKWEHLAVQNMHFRSMKNHHQNFNPNPRSQIPELQHLKSPTSEFGRIPNPPRPNP